MSVIMLIRDVREAVDTGDDDALVEALLTAMTDCERGLITLAELGQIAREVRL